MSSGAGRKSRLFFLYGNVVEAASKHWLAYELVFVSTRLR